MSLIPDLPDPRGTVPLNDHDRTRVRVLPRHEWLSRPNHGLPYAEVPGYMRVIYAGLTASKCQTCLAVMPIGQSSPRHDSKNEHVVTVLSGAFEYVVNGERYHVGELEQIFLPVGVSYEYRNVALQESWFLNIINPIDEWPHETAQGMPTGTYEPIG